MGYCEAVVHPGSRYGATPEPPEYCDDDALEDSDRCARHQEEW